MAESRTAALQGRIEAHDIQMQNFQDTLGRQVQQRMDQMELNCNANVGEAVAAGIEEIRESAATAGVFSQRSYYMCILQIPWPDQPK